MKSPKTLVLILAGGEGKRLGVLTQVRAKPSMPYAGIYRLIDFPLSNCVHSGLSDVWVIEQFEPHALNDHLANGRPWDLDRTYGGLRILPPHTSSGKGEGFAHGNADAIYRNREVIREFGPDVILVLSADHVYKLDYRDVLAAHRDRKADVTMVTTRVELERAGRFGNVFVADDGKVSGFAYKPDPPQSEIVTTEVFVYDAHVLLETLDDLAEGEDGLEDFGHQLIPELVERGKTHAFELEGYWRDVGTIPSYWESHMELLRPEPPLDLEDPAWPILTYGVQRVPARIRRGAEIIDSLIASGCDIRGTVERSVLAPGVMVEEGAWVVDAVILHDTRIGRGAHVERAIVDDHAEIGDEARIGGDCGDLTLVGQRSRVAAGVQVSAGAHLEPESGRG